MVFVYDGEDAADFDAAERLATDLIAEIGETTSEGQTFRIDARLRPEGNQGPLARSLAGFERYYDRWGLTWERQALVKARFVAGDPELGARFCALVEQVVYGQPFGDDDARDVRRMKARIERERIPPGEDPQFHLKLGRGSLSDVEFCVQLFQLQHGGAVPELRVPGTIDRHRRAARARSCSTRRTQSALEAAYRFCERTRNALYLHTGSAGRRAARPTARSGSGSAACSATFTSPTRRCATTTDASPGARRRWSSACSTERDDANGTDDGGKRPRRARPPRQPPHAAVGRGVRRRPRHAAVHRLRVRAARFGGSDYHPYQDHAIIEWRTRDLFEHFPLVGPYSRFDWFHPGPALFAVLALPYHLAGATSGALAFSALVVNGAAVLATLLIARRRGGLPMLMVTGAVVLVLVERPGAAVRRAMSGTLT